jgi:hypothetical protein
MAMFTTTRHKSKFSTGKQAKKEAATLMREEREIPSLPIFSFS